MHSALEQLNIIKNKVNDIVEQKQLKIHPEIIVVTNGVTHFYFNFNKETKEYHQSKDLKFYKKLLYCYYVSQHKHPHI